MGPKLVCAQMSMKNVWLNWN